MKSRKETSLSCLFRLWWCRKIPGNSQSCSGEADWREQMSSGVTVGQDSGCR